MRAVSLVEHSWNIRNTTTARCFSFNLPTAARTNAWSFARVDLALGADSRRRRVGAGLVSTDEPRQEPPAPAERIERQVHRDVHEIGLERRLAAKAREGAVKANERLLADVVGVVAVAEHADGRGGDRSLIPLDECLE